MGAVSRLLELSAKVDAFGARVASRYPGELACGPGCDDCCNRRLSVTGVEAALIREALARLDAPARAAIARRAASAPASVCAALDAERCCSIYAVRPLVCRSHGVPIRFEPDERSAPSGQRSRLPIIDACSKNFVGRDLALLDPDSVMNQATLSTLLAAIDAAHADETARPRGQRFELLALLEDGDRDVISENT
jgi:hypothetical protein